MSVGMKHAMNKAAKARGATALGFGRRTSASGTDLGCVHITSPDPGAEQFIRISTPVIGSNLEAGDRLLQEFLGTWLTLEDYKTELRAWQARKG
jgi:hypothetical protein